MRAGGCRAGPRRPSRRSFSERLGLRGRTSGAAGATGRRRKPSAASCLPPAACPRLLARGALGQGDPEARRDPRLQVHAPPAHHTVHGKGRPLARHRRQLGLLRRAQARSGPGRAAVRQPLQAFGALAMNPIAARLPIRPAARGGGPAAPPSGSRALADIRPAAVASSAFAATARSWCAESSVRAIATAINPSMVP
jgi:hypothetical protein